MEWKTDLSEKWIEESTAASDTDNYGYLSGEENTIPTGRMENILRFL